MIISEKEHNQFLKDQIGKPCKLHGTTIKKGKYGNWCGQKDEFGYWCMGNSYPVPENETLTIRSQNEE